jgi:hypothetical protein
MSTFPAGRTGVRREHKGHGDHMAARPKHATPFAAGVASSEGSLSLPPDAADSIPLDTSLLLSIQQVAGNGAATEAVAARGRSAPGTPGVQRKVDAAIQTWLKDLVTAKGGALATKIGGDPGAKLLPMDMGDRVDTVATVWGDVDAFETAVAASPGFGDMKACRIVSAIEDSQPISTLGIRLPNMLLNSADPLLGLAAMVTMDEEHVRAALQAVPPLSKPAIAGVLPKLAKVAVPAHLAPWNNFVATLGRELADPNNADVTASSAARETKVTDILTPPAVKAAKAAAAAAGKPPPAFIEAAYYDDLMAALHKVATDSFKDADETNKRKSMDMSKGGRVEQVAGEAKRRVDALFGAFGSFGTSQLTVGTNLFDQSARPGNPWDMARWFVRDSGDDEIVKVDDAHHSFGVDKANPIRDDVIDHYSNTPAKSGHAPPAGLDAKLGVGGPERSNRLRLTDRMWPGMQSMGKVFLTPREGKTPADTRRMYWNLFKTCIHEYLHTTANATYTAWYSGLTDPHHKITYQEGFTDLFTRKAWHSVFPEEVASNTAFRQTVQGSADVDLAAARGDPPHYPEMAEAELIEKEIGLANMRAGFFRGNTAVLGGKTLPHT